MSFQIIPSDILEQIEFYENKIIEYKAVLEKTDNLMIVGLILNASKNIRHLKKRAEN